LKPANWLLFILYYSFINPIIEEVYWRGYLGSKVKTLTWSDVCYAGYHPLVFLKFVAWPWALVEFVLLLGVAWMWRMIIRKYDGLLLPVLMHLFADLSIGFAIYLLARSIP
jgi:membrane protease YdiL (CAAX protease family)